MSKKWIKTAKAIGAIDIESGKDGVYLTTEQVDAIEAALPDAESEVQKKLATQEKSIQDLTKAANDSKEALTTAQTTIASLTQEKETLTAKVAELSKKPGATPTTVVKEADINASVATDAPTRLVTKAEEERNSLASLRAWNFGAEENTEA